MPAGRPRKPTALHVINGNPGKRKLPDNEPQPAAVGTLDPPEHLDELAASFWRVHAPELIRLRLLTALDVEEFATACQQHSMYSRLWARINRSPFGKNAGEWTRRANKALEARDRILAKFGFTPSDRAKLNVQEKPADPFEDFLAGKRAK